MTLFSHRPSPAVSALLVAFVTTSLATGQEMAQEGTLADYLSLPEEGVTIGNAVFSDFKLLPRQTGASGFMPDFIFVSPTNSANGPGFFFDLSDGVTADDFFQLRFSFKVTGIYAKGAEVELLQANVNPDLNSGADAIVDFTSPELFEGSFGSLIAFATPNDELAHAALSFTPIKQFTVEVDTVLDGGGQGRPGETNASLLGVALDFQWTPPPAPVPLKTTRSGLINPSTFFIEIQSDPFTRHQLMASDGLDDDFPTPVSLSDGSLVTNAQGYARLVFDLASFGPSHFFRVQKAL